jgi:multidrug efflux pump subunit AcrA (membrane-fusion protein)
MYRPRATVSEVNEVIMYKRLGYVILVGTILIGVAAFVRNRSLAQPGSSAAGVQEVGAAERGDILVTVSATAPLQAKRQVSLTFPITGKVTTVNVEEGDFVRKGQVIAMLDTQVYQDNLAAAEANVLAKQIALQKLQEKPRQVDIDAAQANLNLAQARFKEASASGTDKLQAQIDQLNVDKAKTSLWQSQLQRDADDKAKADLQKDPRTAPMASSLPSDRQHNKDLTSKEFDVQIQQSMQTSDQSKMGDISSMANAQAQVTSAQVALDNLIKGPGAEDIAQAQAQVDASQAAVEQVRRNLAKGSLVAPFDGVVARLNVHLGEAAPTTGPAAIMLDTSTFYVDVAVDERDIAKVATGQIAALTFDGLPGVSVNGKVTYIAPTATRNGDVVTYLVRAEIDPAGQTLLTSMSATVGIITDQAKDVVRLRNRFIRLNRATGKALVDVLQADGSYKQVEVTLGLRNDTYSEIKSGLNAGDGVGILTNRSRTTGSFGGPGGTGN